MTFLSRMTLGVALALGIGGLFGAVRAAEPPTPPSASFGPARMCGDMDARMAGRLAYMETKLGLTDAQKPAFKTLSETMKAANAPMREACATMTAQPTATTLPERMESMQTMMAARSASMATVLPAMTAFYKTLTPEQQKIADSSMMGGMGGGGMGGHHGGRHGSGGWGGGPMMGR